MNGDDLDLLMLKHLDGTLSGAERERLNRALNSNPEACRRLIQLADEELMFKRGLTGAPEIRSRDIPRPIFNQLSWRGAAIAALLLLGLGIGAISHFSNSKNTGSVQPAKPTIEIPKPPERVDEVVYNLDLSKELPQNWNCGLRIADNLPPNASGAIRQVMKPEVKDHAGIFSNHAGPNGSLFVLTSDATVHLTYKVATGGPFTIDFAVRDPLQGRNGQMTYLISPKSTAWESIAVPVTDFENAKYLTEAKDGLNCSLYSFDTHLKDLGLTVSEFRITRPRPTP